MSDRQLQALLRRVSQGDNDAIASAVNAAARLGFSVADIRQEITDRWVPYYSSINELTRDRTTLRAALVAGETAFPDYSFFNKRNQFLLSDSEWRLFAADCVDHVLFIWKEFRPQNTRISSVIDVARRFALGEATEKELDLAHRIASLEATEAEENGAWATQYVAEAAEAAAESKPWAATWKAIGAAGEYASRPYSWPTDAGFIRENIELGWQRQRLSDYLVGLGALPPPVDNE